MVPWNLKNIAVILTTSLSSFFFLSFQAILRLARQAASLIQLTHSTPLLNVVTRGFAWIWITIERTLYTHVHTGELFIPVFYAFWIQGFGMFLPVLISDLRWIS